MKAESRNSENKAVDRPVSRFPAHWRRLRATRHGHGRCAAMLWLALACPITRAHVVPPEQFHPVVEGYRRMIFLLNLNPVRWNEVEADVERVAAGLETVSQRRAGAYRTAVNGVIAKAAGSERDGDEPPGPALRREAARTVFDLSTRAVARLLSAELEELKGADGRREEAGKIFERARQYWAAFEHEVKATDLPMFREIGLRWLEMANGLGSAPLLGEGEVPVDARSIREASDDIIAYVNACYGNFYAPEGRALAPLPLASRTFDALAAIPPRLPPGSDVNKQRPRPRQILNLITRGADETEAPLVAFGDMVFDSPLIFGEPARSLGISCNSCHNKGTTNPGFRIPGLSGYAGGIDVSSNFFAPHANNGVFDPLDSPDLRGIRFTAPYGRNGRFSSLRDFIRNVIVNEFNGPEPDPIAVDAMLAYMMEFDFLPNPSLRPDGTLRDGTPAAARRGEALFNTPFPQMNGMSCASCHVPSDHFVDHRRHDIGSVSRSEENALDGALDTPTLLSAKFTAPYFHDGSQPTLRDVVLWFERTYDLGFDPDQVADLTAYLESVGDGIAPYEEDPDAASPGEVEEQYIFVSAWEFIRDRNKPELADLLFRTVARELRNEKWGLKYSEAGDVVEKMARLADDCVAAIAAGQTTVVNTRVAEFRRLYEENKSFIDGETAGHAGGAGTVVLDATALAPGGYASGSAPGLSRAGNSPTKTIGRLE